MAVVAVTTTCPYYATTRDNEVASYVRPGAAYWHDWPVVIVIVIVAVVVVVVVHNITLLASLS